MSKRNEAILSIDTSNYTTSVAVIDREHKILADRRTVLHVKAGERGLRQQDAIFQHIDHLPLLLEEAFLMLGNRQICAVAASERPRPTEGSYMPVFRAGVSFGKSIASALSVPFFTFSHQEGHLAASAVDTKLAFGDEILAFHLSGGTCELLKTRLGSETIEKLGGTNDISFGQLIDRIGVASGMAFPSGRELDDLVCAYVRRENETVRKSLLKPIPFKGLSVNVSGIETQAMRMLESDLVEKEQVIESVFVEIANCLIRWSTLASQVTQCNKILFSGGVSASKHIRERLLDALPSREILVDFGREELSSDNAVGIGILGGMVLWR